MECIDRVNARRKARTKFFLRKQRGCCSPKRNLFDPCPYNTSLTLTRHKSYHGVAESPRSQPIEARASIYPSLVQG
jgi:hypothetical protein